MGPLRGGLILSLTPVSALAEACAELRPNWTGGPVTALQEALQLAISVPSVLLMCVTVLALRLRNQWVGLIAVVGWTIWTSVLSLGESATRIAARIEGCVGPSALFIALVAAICVGTILYTAPIGARKPDGD